MECGAGKFNIVPANGALRAAVCWFHEVSRTPPSNPNEPFRAGS